MAYLGIDHLVIAVVDPDAAAAGLERDLGLVFTGGGRHETAGTWNRLAFLGDAYVELIGVFDRGLLLAHPAFPVGRAALEALDAGREGLVTWAIAVDDCAAAATRLRAHGSSIGEPVTGERRRPDGEVVRWVTAFPALGPDEPPFLIEHEMAGAEWGPDALAGRRAFRHPGLGRVRLDRLVLQLDDPRDYAERCEDVVDVRFREEASAWIGYVGFDPVWLQPGRGEPTIRLSALATGVEPRRLARHSIDWRIDPA